MAEIEHGGKIDGLNEKQSKALRYYVASGEKRQAAIDAGYSPKSAAGTMTTILKNPKAKEWLAAQRKEAEEETGVELRDAIEQLARMAFVDPIDLIGDDGAPRPLSAWPKAARMAVQQIGVVSVGNDQVGRGEVLQIKLADRNGAVDKLVKILGGYEKDNEQKNPADALMAAITDGEDTRSVLDAIRRRTRGEE